MINVDISEIVGGYQIKTKKGMNIICQNCKIKKKGVKIVDLIADLKKVFELSTKANNFINYGFVEDRDLTQFSTKEAQVNFSSSRKGAQIASSGNRAQIASSGEYAHKLQAAGKTQTDTFSSCVVVFKNED